MQRNNDSGADFLRGRARATDQGPPFAIPERKAFAAARALAG